MSDAMRFGPVAGTDPYPWPWNGTVDVRDVALVLVGWDTHWAARAVGATDTAIDAIGTLTSTAQACGMGVYGVVHPRPRRAPNDAPDPVALGGDAVVTVAAGGIDAFAAGPLDVVLRADGRTHLLVAGHGLEGPVHSTLRSANDRGYECLLVVDACTALTSDAAASAAHSVTMSGGIFGAIGLTADVVEALACLPDDPFS